MDPITIIAAATAAVKAGAELYNFISGLRASAKQKGEWTDEQESAFQALIEERAKQPQWQSDPS